MFDKCAENVVSGQGLYVFCGYKRVFVILFYRILPSFGGISTEMVEETQTPSMQAVLCSLETNGVRWKDFLSISTPY